MKILRLLSTVAVLSFLPLSTETAIAGQSDQMCPAPIMVCQNAVGTPDGCPAAYDCRCSELSRRCSRDEDCRPVATSTECEGTCGTAVNRLRAPFVARAVHYLDHKICSAYQDDGCNYATPRCATLDVACIEGKCTNVTPASPESPTN